jgi:hypothetical protein|tara:strand:- start:7142 stop:7252 length:111 start_codon:yes stop_codon:yes gene_type:complete
MICPHGGGILHLIIDFITIALPVLFPFITTIRRNRL